MTLFTYQTRNYGGSLPSINWAHPITRGLTGAFLPGYRYNIADGRFFTNQYATVATVGSRQRGRAIVAGAYQTPEPPNSSSVHAKFDRNVLTALVVSMQDTATNAGFSFFRGNGSGTPGWRVGLWGGTNNGPYVTMGSWTANFDLAANYTRTPHVIVLAADGTTATCYSDGVSVGSSSYTAPTYQYSSARSVFFGAVNGINSATQDRPSLGLFWNRALTPNEIKLVSENPEIVFQPVARNIFVPSGDTPTTIDASIGEASATGLGATVFQETYLNAGIGDASATGPQAGVTQSFAANASVGEAASGGLSATVSQGSLIEAAVGESAASGLTASIEQSFVVGATVGNAAASGLGAQIPIETVIGAAAGVAQAAGLQAIVVSTSDVVLGSLIGTTQKTYLRRPPNRQTVSRNKTETNKRARS